MSVFQPGRIEYTRTKGSKGLGMPKELKGDKEAPVLWAGGSILTGENDRDVEEHEQEPPGSIKDFELHPKGKKMP